MKERGMKVGFPVRSKYYVFFSSPSRPDLEKHDLLENIYLQYFLALS
jgi:hypothetical protein